MKLEEVAKALGYTDVEHLESNIELYGEPLIQWWGSIRELVNKLNTRKGTSESNKPPCIQNYIAWKEKNPDEGYQYDEIHEFTATLSRGDLLDLLEYASEK